jgi:CRP-like cAMP-binding protein
MAAADPEALIGRTALFRGLAGAERRAVAAEMREVRFDAGRQIFAKGDSGREIYLVIDGRVRLSVLTPEGRELSFAHAGPGDIFGEIAMLDGGGRSADATAVTATHTLTLGKPAFLRLMQAYPVLADAVLKFLCARIREADEQLEAIALYPIEARLARLLLAQAAPLAEFAKTSAVSVPLGMSQSELALLVGASRPKVNAALALLEAEGAIERDGNRVTCILDQLRRIAGRD